ncbi:MAG TPA: hypothetical protein PK668_20855 [Myxococcota bacterium]|nr:hypothetical protein [Myxococcota bacterium]HRY96638.1 hypothetical protein [Myxococcota bacterium]
MTTKFLIAMPVELDEGLLDFLLGRDSGNLCQTDRSAEVNSFLKALRAHGIIFDSDEFISRIARSSKEFVHPEIRQRLDDWVASRGKRVLTTPDFDADFTEHAACIAGKDYENRCSPRQFASREFSLKNGDCIHLEPLISNEAAEVLDTTIEWLFRSCTEFTIIDGYALTDNSIAELFSFIETACRLNTHLKEIKVICFKSQRPYEFTSTADIENRVSGHSYQWSRANKISIYCAGFSLTHDLHNRYIIFDDRCVMATYGVRSLQGRAGQKLCEIGLYDRPTKLREIEARVVNSSSAITWCSSTPTAPGSSRSTSSTARP